MKTFKQLSEALSAEGYDEYRIEQVNSPKDWNPMSHGLQFLKSTTGIGAMKFLTMPDAEKALRKITNGANPSRYQSFARLEMAKPVRVPVGDFVWVALLQVLKSPANPDSGFFVLWGKRPAKLNVEK